jgi:hypothetical protein
MFAMKQFTLTRFHSHWFTHGILIVPGSSFFTLEQPWLNNQPLISCIPTGVYTCEYVEKTAGHLHDYYIRDVPGRGGIFLCRTNKLSELNGNIGIGKGWNEPAAETINPDKAMAEFHTYTSKHIFELQINWYEPTTD